MIKFCRNCGSELADPGDRSCRGCRANAIKGTAYCRYCGHPTKTEDSTCAYCGASIKPLPNSVRTLFEYPRLSAKLGKAINLSIVVVLIAAYVVFTLPQKVTKPVVQATSDAVMASTGFTALPLNSISAVPPLIPELANYGMTYVPPGITVNSTRKLTVYAVYKNTNSVNATRAIRLEEITDNCTYISEDEHIAAVDRNGLVRATGPGSVIIKVSYTAAPGSSNISAASEGKKLVTFTAEVQVFVR